jgi:hypothetical protein
MNRAPSPPGPTRLGILVVLASATLGATGPQCGGTPPAGGNSTADAGDDAGPAADAAPSLPAPDAAVRPSDGGSSNGDALSPPGDSSALAADAGTVAPDDASEADGSSAAPTWATWPMPNAPSSGLLNPQSYDTSVAGIAVDRVTGLTWQRDFKEVTTQQTSDANTVIAAGAAACASLTLAGFDDWRVPTRIELVSLLDFTTAPAANSTVFGVTGDTFLSSSAHPAMGVGMTNQAVDSSGVLAGVVYLAPYMGEFDNGGPIAVRCVRGGAAPEAPHYTIASGTVHDNWTGLTWTQAPSASTMLESAVRSYCTSQTLAGGGWRAPSVNELETLFGDFYSPDTVSMDSTTFTGAAGGFGSLDYSNGSASSGNLWFVVGGDAETGVQQDITSVPPIVGFEPAEEYWVSAECVR